MGPLYQALLYPTTGPKLPRQSWMTGDRGCHSQAGTWVESSLDCRVYDGGVGTEPAEVHLRGLRPCHPRCKGTSPFLEEINAVG